MAMKSEVEVFWVVPWRWRQQGPPKCWYPITTLQSVTNQKTSTWIVRDYFSHR